MKSKRAILVMTLLLAGAASSFGFALLGPYADWMNLEAGYRVPGSLAGYLEIDTGFPGDIGGPMNIGEGYRWNVPVITYGFDRSFLDYFGSNGVAAVEGAIANLNQLPPASLLNLQNYPTAVRRINYTAEATTMVDLQSMALCALVEQMGLADPSRYVFTVRNFNLQPGGTNYLFDVVQRNFDSVTAQPSATVNGALMNYQILQFSDSVSPPPSNVFCITYNFTADDTQPRITAVASQRLGPGYYLTGLSQDDVSGLRYLLNGNLVNYESLPPDVTGTGSNTANFVQAAYRPGIEKITFMRHPSGLLSGAFAPFTNQWTDISYNAGDYPYFQEVQRVTSRPDILFRGADLGVGGMGPAWTRTGTSNWVNNANLNGNFGGAGPGVIVPPITITFNTGGSFFVNVYQLSVFKSGLDQIDASVIGSWGSYDGSAKPPILYPEIQVVFQPTRVNLQLSMRGGIRTTSFPLSGAANARFDLQTGTNLTNWTTLTVLTNSGAIFNYQFPALTNEARRFFRAVQQP